MRRCHCATRWAPAGTSPMRRCSLPRTKQASSPAWPCRWTAAPASGGAEVTAASSSGQADVALALAVLDEHLAALNEQDNARLCATLHFPHYRLAGGKMQVWEGPERYLADFHS